MSSSGSDSSSFEDSKPNSPIGLRLQAGGLNPYSSPTGAAANAKVEVSIGASEVKPFGNSQGASISYRVDANVPAPQLPSGGKASTNFPGSRQPEVVSENKAPLNKPPIQGVSFQVSSPPSSEASKPVLYGDSKARAAGFSGSISGPSVQQPSYYQQPQAVSNQPHQAYPEQRQPQPQLPASHQKPYNIQADVSMKSEIPLNGDNKPIAPKADDNAKAEKSDNSDERLLCMSLKIWLFLFIGLMGFLFILIIGCLATPRWAYQGDSDLELIGGLLVCTDCPGDLDGEKYADIIDDDDYCDSDNFDGLCDVITKLERAGGTYLAFSIFTIIVLLVWTAFLALNIFKKKFPGPAWIPYLFPALALLFNFIAIAAWGGLSEAKFKNKSSCDTFSLSSEEDICATDGPGLALFIFLYLILYGAAFAVFYFLTLRKKTEDKEVDSSKALKEAPKYEDRV